MGLFDLRLCFLIVHPHLDEPIEHIDFGGDEDNFPVVIQRLTDKGKWTISLLSALIQEALSHSSPN